MDESQDVNYLYNLKNVFFAHETDIYALKSSGNIFYTAGREENIKQWMPEGKSFKECSTFVIPKHTIYSLCIVPASETFPDGLLLAGSTDNSILGFANDSSQPILRLTGHSAPVISLSYGGGETIISGSFDKTARVWSGQHCTLILKGHLDAIWSTDIIPAKKLILTGSADGSIRLWHLGRCERVFDGHTDGIKELAVMSYTKFLSCSKDATIRLWIITGECLKIFNHTDSVFGISPLLNSDTDFVSCGEDRRLKIWRNNLCFQTFVFPGSKCLWRVTVLSNGDLVVAANDGKVYVFEKISSKCFEESLEEHSLDNDMLPADHECASVSGASDLKSSGETIIMYQNENDWMYIINTVKGIKVRKDVRNSQYIEDMLNDEGAGNQPMSDNSDSDGTSSSHSVIDLVSDSSEPQSPASGQ